MDRFRDSDPRRRWLRHLELGFLLMLASCSQLPTTNSVTIPRIPAGEAPLGIVYATDAAADPGVKIVGVFLEDTHPPIVYPIALTADSKTPSAARLLQFLTSPAASDWGANAILRFDPKPSGSYPFLYPTATPACGSLLVAKARFGGPNPRPTSSS